MGGTLQTVSEESPELALNTYIDSDKQRFLWDINWELGCELMHLWSGNRYTLLDVGVGSEHIWGLAYVKNAASGNSCFPAHILVRPERLPAGMPEAIKKYCAERRNIVEPELLRKDYSNEY